MAEIEEQVAANEKALKDLEAKLANLPPTADVFSLTQEHQRPPGGSGGIDVRLGRAHHTAGEVAGAARLRSLILPRKRDLSSIARSSLPSSPGPGGYIRTPAAEATFATASRDGGMVDAAVSKTVEPKTRAGSSPAPGTTFSYGGVFFQERRVLGPWLHVQAKSPPPR